MANLTQQAELKLQLAQEASQSGILRFLEEAEDRIVNMLIAEYRGPCNHDRIIGGVAALAEIRSLQAQCIKRIKDGIEAGERLTTSGV